MELRRTPAAISDLIGLRVVDASGRMLGRVFEVVATSDVDGLYVIAELLLGPRALLWRMRGPGIRVTKRIAWAQVAKVGEDTIEVTRA